MYLRLCENCNSSTVCEPHYYIKDCTRQTTCTLPKMLYSTVCSLFCQDKFAFECCNWPSFYLFPQQKRLNEVSKKDSLEVFPLLECYLLQEWCHLPLELFPHLVHYLSACHLLVVSLLLQWVAPLVWVLHTWGPVWDHRTTCEDRWIKDHLHEAWVGALLVVVCPLVEWWDLPVVVQWCDQDRNAHWSSANVWLCWPAEILKKHAAHMVMDLCDWICHARILMFEKLVFEHFTSIAIPGLFLQLCCSNWSISSLILINNCLMLLILTQACLCDCQDHSQVGTIKRLKCLMWKDTKSKKVATFHTGFH